MVEMTVCRSPVDLERKSVEWLAAASRYFDPDTAPESGVMFARKALVEAALLVGLRARQDGVELDPGTRVLRDKVAEIAARASYRELVARDDRALLLYACTCAALRLCGQDDPDFDHAIDRAVNSRYATAFERIPYRQLDLLHTLELLEVDHSLPSVAATLPFTLLCADPSVVRLSDSDTYAITHTIFYATDFGTRTPDWPESFSLSRAVEILESLLVLCRRRGNADLVGELLCCLSCLGIHDSPESGPAWEFLARSQEPSGRVDGPDGIVHPVLGADDTAYRAWATGYHTTLIVALAGMLHRNRVIVTDYPVPAPRSRRAELTTAVRGGVTWLVDAVDGEPLRTALPMLAAAVRGARTTGGLPRTRAALTETLARAEREPDHTWDSYSADIVLEIARGCAGLGLACAPLSRMLGDLGASLAEADSVPPEATCGVLALTDLGHLARGRGADLLRSSKPRRSVDLAASPVDTAQRLASTHDPRLGPIGQPHEWRPVAEHLFGALAPACQAYDLGQVAALVRGLALLGLGGHRITLDAVDFLLGQQHRSGAIGFPACDDGEARERAHRAWTQAAVVGLSALLEAPVGTVVPSPGRTSRQSG
ncbi:hypothetical protein AB0H12_33745 [Actinosynnema sp. NPDC023794]